MMNKGKWACSAVAVLLLCAMTAAQAAVAFRAATSTRQAATASGGTITVLTPAGTVSGDVLLASIAVVSITSTVATPAGWTLVQNTPQSSGNKTRLYTFYRVAGGSEPGSYAWTFSGANSGAVAALASFSGADISASPIDASAAQTTSDASFNHTAPSVTTTVAGDMLVTVHEYASSRNWTPPTGMMERADLYSDTNGGNTGVSMELNTESRSVAGATGARTAKVPSNKDRGATHAIALKAPVVVVTPGDFNSYDTSTTPATATDGKIKTKVAGPFTVDIVALNTAKTAILTSFTGAVKVELLNAANNSAALDANDCRSSWSTIQTVSPNPTFVAANNGRLTVSLTENNAYRDVRVRVTYPASGTPTKIGCSSDNFALRPANFTGLTVNDADWQSAGTARALSNTGASGGVVHKAGRPFRIDAVARNAGGTGIAYGAAAGNYNGLPQAQLISCVLPASCTPGTLDQLGAASAWTAGAVSGSFYSATASYSDAGSFTMQLVDSTFAAVDAGDATPADCSGQYVCSATVNVGRFVPDHFELVDASAADPLVDTAVDSWLPLAAPQFRTFNLTDASCNAAAPAPKRAFTYIGQPFGYVSVPQFTFKAMDAGDNPINNYQGALMKLTASGVTQTYTAASGTLDTALALGTPTLTLNANYTNGNDSPVVGKFAVNAADKLAFQRIAPVAPFNAAINLSIAVQDSSENAVAGNGNITATAPVVFNTIGFDAGSLMRFGRLKLSNAHGSDLLNLPIPMVAQFYNGTVFVTNALDNCTAISANNVALGNYKKSLSATNMGASHINPGAALLSGRGSLSLSKPAPAAGGSVDIAINLGTAGADQSCLSWTPTMPASSGAGMAYLRGQWCGANQDRDPGARATFGVYKNANEFIYMREMY